ncbi:MAG: MG2 domain-containing protein, partial [Anaerolineae bacterium]
MKTTSSASSSSARADSRRRWLRTGLHLLLVLGVAAGFVTFRWVATAPERVDAQRTILLGPSRLAPDSDASLRVVVQEAGDGRPIDGALVQVSLAAAEGLSRAVPLYEGHTDGAGSLPVQFHVPEDAPRDALLIVETRSDAGRDRLEQAVTIEREYRLLLMTDKPLYQPGQTIHMRAVALVTLDLTAAAGADVDFLVEDAKGNKVYRDSVTASAFGVASADFALADMVNQGDYKLSVAIGETRSEKTVEVRPYVLPKFGVDVST